MLRLLKSSRGFFLSYLKIKRLPYIQIGSEVVWYGNINLLARDKVDGSIMRVLSKEIASELMELTFGNNSNDKIEI